MSIEGEWGVPVLACLKKFAGFERLWYNTPEKRRIQYIKKAGAVMLDPAKNDKGQAIVDMFMEAKAFKKLWGKTSDNGKNKILEGLRLVKKMGVPEQNPQVAEETEGVKPSEQL